jgi:hypothetical protein
VISLLFICLGPFQLHAGVAVIRKVQGEVSIEAADAKKRSLRVGDIVDPGQAIHTGSNSLATIRFEDGHLLGLPENSSVVILKYRFDKASPTNSLVQLRLMRGVMRSATGQIGFTAPQNVSYLVDDVVVDIHGTDVIIATFNRQVAIHVLKGTAFFTYGELRREIRNDQAAYRKAERSNFLIKSRRAATDDLTESGTGQWKDLMRGVFSVEQIIFDIVSGADSSRAQGMSIREMWAPPRSGNYSGGGGSASKN